MPLLAERWPQVTASLARSAGHLGEAQQLLEELAEMDLLAARGPVSYTHLDVYKRQDRFYLEVQRTSRVGDEEYLHAAVALADRVEAPLVATNDVRFIKQDDFEAHETRVCIGEGRTLDDPCLLYTSRCV